MRPLNLDSWDHVFVFHSSPAGDPTGIDDDGMAGINGLPTSYELGTNYPNPFNPITTVRFGLPAATRVRLEVFNIIGQKVATLANEMMPAGYYDVVWNAVDMPSGIYLYRLQAGQFTETRKMVLLK